MELSAECASRLDHLFAAPRERAEARRLLEVDCSPDCEWFPREEVDRIRFAVLRLSDGSLDGLRRALDLARTDFRDLLMAAGFGSPVDGYRSWDPRDPGG